MLPSPGLFEAGRAITPSVFDVVDEFCTTETRSLTPGVPHISKTVAVLTSLIIDKGF